MGQFDSPAEAALSQLRQAELESSPVANMAQRCANLGAAIAELAGFSGATTISGLVTTFMGAAAAKDSANLLYFAETIVGDVRDLRNQSEQLRKRVDGILETQEFNQALQNATVHISRTNLESRLRRLSLVLVNGVRDGDLEPEALDDKMWCAVNLTESDIRVLSIAYELQHDFTKPENFTMGRGQWSNTLMRRWQVWWGKNAMFYNGEKGLEFKQSCAHLMAFGLVGPLDKSYSDTPAQNDIELLLSGKRFYESLRKIADNVGHSK